MSNTEQLSTYIEQMLYYIKVNEQSTICDDVSFQEMQVIMYLGQKHRSNMSDAADHLMVGLSNLTAIADKLVKKGLVQRDRSDEDRRVVIISLTDKGLVVFQKNREQKQLLAQQMLMALEADDQDRLMVLMQKIVVNLGKENQKESD